MSAQVARWHWFPAFLIPLPLLEVCAWNPPIMLKSILAPQALQLTTAAFSAAPTQQHEKTSKPGKGEDLQGSSTVITAALFLLSVSPTLILWIPFQTHTWVSWQRAGFASSEPTEPFWIPLILGGGCSKYQSSRYSDPDINGTYIHAITKAMQEAELWACLHKIRN